MSIAAKIASLVSRNASLEVNRRQNSPFRRESNKYFEKFRNFFFGKLCFDVLTWNFAHQIFVRCRKHGNLKPDMTQSNPAYQTLADGAVVYKKHLLQTIKKFREMEAGRKLNGNLRNPARLYFPRMSVEAMLDRILPVSTSAVFKLKLVNLKNVC